MGEYKVKKERGHYIVVNANNDFILSADTRREAVDEIAILESNQ